MEIHICQHWWISTNHLWKFIQVDEKMLQWHTYLQNIFESRRPFHHAYESHSKSDTYIYKKCWHICAISKSLIHRHHFSRYVYFCWWYSLLLVHIVCHMHFIKFHLASWASGGQVMRNLMSYSIKWNAFEGTVSTGRDVKLDQINESLVWEAFIWSHDLDLGIPGVL